jgi:hypothetical protein
MIEGVLLSGMGVSIAAIAFYNRNKPAWQRDMRRIYIIAIGPLMLGTVTALLVGR